MTTNSHYISISKDEINALPQYKFSGKIILITTREEAIKATEILKHEKYLGFDTETRAAFKKGERYDVCLIQLATKEIAYLFRINQFGIIPELINILSDRNIIKAGVSVKDDIKDINKLYPFQAENFIDLADLAKQNKIKNFGLRALTAICLKERLSKKEKASNWEREALTDSQIQYAANDAVVGLLILESLTTRAFSKDR